VLNGGLNNLLNLSGSFVPLRSRTINYDCGKIFIDNNYLSDIAFDNYNWPLLVIIGGFFATAISGLFAKNIHPLF